MIHDDGESRTGVHMTTYRLAVAGRYAESHAIKDMLAQANLDALSVVITASWMDCPEEGDADLTDEQSVSRAKINRGEIASAHALLYVPSWTQNRQDIIPKMPDHEPFPRWSPGRLIDVGIAFACRVPVIVVGKVEPSIYFRGELVTVCAWGTLRETIQRVLNMKD